MKLQLQRGASFLLNLVLIFTLLLPSTAGAFISAPQTTLDSAVLEDGFLKIRYSAPEGGILLAACYDQNGLMIDLQSRDLSNPYYAYLTSATFQVKSDTLGTCKVFLLDQNYQPQCPQLEAETVFTYGYAVEPGFTHPDGTLEYIFAVDGIQTQIPLEASCSPVSGKVYILTDDDRNGAMNLLEAPLVDPGAITAYKKNSALKCEKGDYTFSSGCKIYNICSCLEPEMRGSMDSLSVRDSVNLILNNQGQVVLVYITRCVYCQ